MSLILELFLNFKGSLIFRRASMVGVCAGSAPTLRCFLVALTEGLRRVGLTVNLNKTEVIPACPSAQSFGRGDFDVVLFGTAPPISSSWVLLSGPMNGAKNFWVVALPKPEPSLSKFPDAQSASCLLRSRSGWSKVLYSCRTVPPDAQRDGLGTADSDIRAANEPADRAPPF